MVKTIKRILIYRIGQLGDTIIALPAMWAIRRHFPEAQLTLLSDAHENDNYVLARSILPEQGLFDQWLSYPAGIDGTSLRGMPKLFIELRRHGFDTLVYLAPRKRTSAQVRRDLLFFYMAGIRTFIGYNGFGPTPARNSGQALPMPIHEADHLLYRLSLDGIPVPTFGCGVMDLQLTADEREGGYAWLAKHCEGNVHQQCLVGVGPGSKAPSKVWPAQRFLELGHRLIKDMGLYPVVFGGPEDSELADYLITHWGLGANAAGQLSIRKAAAALAKCRFYVGNDTGTMHLAAAVGTICVVAFSAQDIAGRWYPYGNGHIILRKKVPCEGCVLKVCDRDLECLKAISVDKMFQACQSLYMKALLSG